jgi:hypothetical protein
MKYIVMLTVSITLFTLPGWADWDIRYHTANNWETAISNFGKFGQNENGDAGAFWPAGSNHNYIFGAGMWCGGVLPNGDTVVSVGYNPHTGQTEFAPGLPYTDPSDPQWRVYLSTDPDYPFDPVSFEDGYAVCNEFDVFYHMPDSFHDPEPLGITIAQKTIVWPKAWAGDVVFIKYIVRNDTTFTINDFYAGFCIDFDIGNEAGTAANDRCGADLDRKMFYGWQESAEPGWDTRGMLGMKLLSSQPLSSFKQFTLASEPHYDRERYLSLAGYDWITGLYEPYDTIWPPPGDQRILISAGPIASLTPGDSIVFDWALIASDDLEPPCPGLLQRADRAQVYFEYGQHHDVTVFSPNGGEIISGVYNITYSATSVTPDPILLDIYLYNEHGMDTVAYETSPTGTYTWDTGELPDCVLGRITVLAFDTTTFGWDMSDGYFTIDNPGNAPPYLQVLSPVSEIIYIDTFSNDTVFAYDTVSGLWDITWFARDPEFQDSLFIDIFCKTQYDTSFSVLASNEPNDSIYAWNTVPYRNGRATLIIETSDNEFTVAETVEVYLYNQISGGAMTHVTGLNNCVNLEVLVHKPWELTGHTYELRFQQYQCLIDTVDYYYYYRPEYIYEIIDSNTGAVVLDTYSLRNGYSPFYDRVVINDFSPLVDGFSIHACTYDPTTIRYENFHYDSVIVMSGTFPQDSIGFFFSGSRMWWGYRGTQLRLDWVTHTSGGLTLLVTDMTHGDTIPYAEYTTGALCENAYGWHFAGSINGSDPSDTLLHPNQINYLFLCGTRIRILVYTFVPEPGDYWIAYPTEHAPPMRGNVYRFTPYVGTQEYEVNALPLSFKLYPVPLRDAVTIYYALQYRQQVKLVIYDVLGRQVRKLKDGIDDPGSYSIMWHGRDDRSRKVAAGVYFCRLTTGESQEQTITQKFIVIR